MTVSDLQTVFRKELIGYITFQSLLLAIWLLEGVLLGLLLLPLLLGLLHCLHFLIFLLTIFLLSVFLITLLPIFFLLILEVEVQGTGVVPVKLTGKTVALMNFSLGVEEHGEDGILLPFSLILDLLLDLPGGNTLRVEFSLHLKIQIGEVLRGGRKAETNAEVVCLVIQKFTGQFLHLREAFHVDFVTDQSLILKDDSPEVRDGLGGGLAGVSATGESLGPVELAVDLHSQRYLGDLLEERLLQQLVSFADGLDLLRHLDAQLSLLLLQGVDGVPGQLLSLLGLLGLALDALEDLSVAVDVVEVVLGMGGEDGVLVVFLLVFEVLIDFGFGFGGRDLLFFAGSAHGFNIIQKGFEGICPGEGRAG